VSRCRPILVSVYDDRIFLKKKEHSF
jgi:hypothetical protein